MEMLLEFYSDNATQIINALALEVIKLVCFDGVRTIINLSKVSTIPCMCTAAPTLGQ